MSEEDNTPMPTPEEQAAAEDLASAKRKVMAGLVSHLSGIGAELVSQFPEPERLTWPYQRPEALALVAAGEAAVLAYSDEQARSIAPFLMDVCDIHYGPAESDPARMAQLWLKANEVHALSTTFLAVGAFVNGLRARGSDQVEAATTTGAVFQLERDIAAEIGVFRAQHPGF